MLDDIAYEHNKQSYIGMDEDADADALPDDDNKGVNTMFSLPLIHQGGYVAQTVAPNSPIFDPN